MNLLRIIFALLCLCGAVSASSSFAEYSKRNPMRFQSKRQLVDSAFWKNVIGNPKFVVPNATSIHIADTGTVLMFAKNYREKRKWAFWRHPKIHMIELHLNETNYKTYDVLYYPLVTFAAELSTSGAVMEREVSTGHGVKYTLDRYLDQDIVAMQNDYGYVSARGRSSFTAESVVCRVNAGGKGQLQVSKRLKHFPEAKFRKIIFSDYPVFEEGLWESISTFMAGETHEGVVVYEDWYHNKHRCVTDAKLLEDPKLRRWIER